MAVTSEYKINPKANGGKKDKTKKLKKNSKDFGKDIKVNDHGARLHGLPTKSSIKINLMINDVPLIDTSNLR